MLKRAANMAGFAVGVLLLLAIVTAIAAYIYTRAAIRLAKLAWRVLKRRYFLCLCWILQKAGGKGY
jgi:cytochrome c oxidase assembly factor CtaG